MVILEYTYGQYGNFDLTAYLLELDGSAEYVAEDSRTPYVFSK